MNDVRTTDAAPYFFVSHASVDNAALRLITSSLEKEGIGLWIDKPTARKLEHDPSANIASLQYGEAYDTQLRTAIGGAAGFLILISKAAYGSRVVQQELAVAQYLSRRPAEEFKIYPLLMNSGDDRWATEMSTLEHGFQFYADGSWEEGFCFNDSSARELRQLATELRAHADRVRRAGRPDLQRQTSFAQGPEHLGRVTAFALSQARLLTANLLMVLGVSRRPAIAVTVGVDASNLLNELRATEDLVSRHAGKLFGSRTWRLDSQSYAPPEGDALGLIWQVEAPSEMGIENRLAEVFHSARNDRGDTLVIALPPGAGALADWIVDVISRRTCSPPRPGRGVRIPIQAWTDSQTEAVGGRTDQGLQTLLSALAAKTFEHHNDDLVVAHGLRWDPTGKSSIWRSANAEALRLHDLSVAFSEQADSSSAADANRAAAIITGTASNRDLLHSLASLPVSGAVLQTLTASPGLTRDVAGLLTVAERRAYRHPWPEQVAEAHRPASLGVFTLKHEESVA